VAAEKEPGQAFAFSAFSLVTIGSMEFLHVFGSGRFQCAMNFEAFHANRNSAGVALRQAVTASREGVR
jgi:hypothetical protein